ncbi:MAG: hypothetical protein CRU78_15175 [Candidatus Accumulibacter phosphatis]|uniref:Uncharacterized protein n=1 Tax=Candidatus Accumulibacter phosphatis TaxID=327160 RepID=A0A6A7RWD0_9PROT|nr:hypothetical protein [Candidatus Accumulibacter phosphatis]
MRQPDTVAFGGKASHRTRSRFEIFGKLILDNCVKGSVDGHVGQLNAFLSMIFFHKTNAQLLVKRQPFLGVRGLIGIVTIHRSGRLTTKQKGSCTLFYR